MKNKNRYNQVLVIGKVVYYGTKSMVEETYVKGEFWFRMEKRWADGQWRSVDGKSDLG